MRRLLMLLIGSLLVLPGCKNVDVQPHAPAPDAGATPLDPPYVLKPEFEETPPWYRNLQVVLEQKADETELKAIINSNREAVSKAQRELMDEIRQAAEARRQGSDKWTIHALYAGRGTKRPADVMINADVGLTKMYSKRPAVSFNNVRLELCVAKLCREAEIYDMQPKGHNPLVQWSKSDVSAYEALEGILAAHGYEGRFTDILHRCSIRAQDYPTREAFVAAAADAILAKGKELNAARPALIVRLKETSPPAKPADVKPADAKAPEVKKTEPKAAEIKKAKEESVK